MCIYPSHNNLENPILGRYSTSSHPYSALYSDQPSKISLGPKYWLGGGAECRQECRPSEGPGGERGHVVHQLLNRNGTALWTASSMEWLSEFLLILEIWEKMSSMFYWYRNIGLHKKAWPRGIRHLWSSVKYKTHSKECPAWVETWSIQRLLPRQADFLILFPVGLQHVAG